MKNLIVLFIIVWGSLQICACKKDNQKNRVIHGRIIDSTTHIPITNAAFTFYVGQSSGVSMKYVYNPYDFTTDSNGYFKVNFTANDGAAIVINYSGLYPVGNKGLWANGVNYYTSDFNTGIIYAIKK
ncbi:MAG: hypothetical protein ACRDE2_15850 [Chitinophagaceae bacterium]